MNEWSEFSGVSYDGSWEREPQPEAQLWTTGTPMLSQLSSRWNLVVSAAEVSEESFIYTPHSGQRPYELKRIMKLKLLMSFLRILSSVIDHSFSLLIFPLKKNYFLSLLYLLWMNSSIHHCEQFLLQFNLAVIIKYPNLRNKVGLLFEIIFSSFPVSWLIKTNIN